MLSVCDGACKFISSLLCKAGHALLPMCCCSWICPPFCTASRHEACNVHAYACRVQHCTDCISEPAQVWHFHALHKWQHACWIMASRLIATLACLLKLQYVSTSCNVCWQSVCMVSQVMQFGSRTQATRANLLQFIPFACLLSARSLACPGLLPCNLL